MSAFDAFLIGFGFTAGVIAAIGWLLLLILAAGGLGAWLREHSR